MVVGSLLCFKNPVTQVAYTPPSAFTLIIDKNGYIGSKQPSAGNTYYAYLDKRADFSESGLGQVTVFIPEIGEVTIGDKTYKTTKIGNQTWLAENLDLKWDGLNIVSEGLSSTNPLAYYYNNDKNTYGWDGLKCGLLYNYPAISYMITNKNTLFPGWHVPSKNEWDSMDMLAGSGNTIVAYFTRIKLNWGYAWNGNNEYKFNLIPSGAYNGQYLNLGKSCHFWTSDRYFIDSYYNEYIFNSGTTISSSAHSIRLVKDT